MELRVNMFNRFLLWAKKFRLLFILGTCFVGLTYSSQFINKRSNDNSRNHSREIRKSQKKKRTAFRQKRVRDKISKNQLRRSRIYRNTRLTKKSIELQKLHYQKRELEKDRKNAEALAEKLVNEIASQKILAEQLAQKIALKIAEQKRKKELKELAKKRLLAERQRKREMERLAEIRRLRDEKLEEERLETERKERIRHQREQKRKRELAREKWMAHKKHLAELEKQAEITRQEEEKKLEVKKAIAKIRQIGSMTSKYKSLIHKRKKELAEESIRIQQLKTKLANIERSSYRNEIEKKITPKPKKSAAINKKQSYLSKTLQIQLDSIKKFNKISFDNIRITKKNRYINIKFTMLNLSSVTKEGYLHAIARFSSQAKTTFIKSPSKVLNSYSIITKKQAGSVHFKMRRMVAKNLTIRRPSNNNYSLTGLWILSKDIKGKIEIMPLIDRKARLSGESNSIRL